MAYFSHLSVEQTILVVKYTWWTIASSSEDVTTWMRWGKGDLSMILNFCCTRTSDTMACSAPLMPHRNVWKVDVDPGKNVPQLLYVKRTIEWIAWHFDQSWTNFTMSVSMPGHQAYCNLQKIFVLRKMTEIFMHKVFTSITIYGEHMARVWY